ncbi:LysR substrate-binding domain-containing protein [Aureicoccus marinus]|uniref:HTH lysR-type domain-containing protein n=1 Tax=Aureicoccus marinus TaxID=754435 RepID=A0A2S7T7D7_9FLAO|nr:LysR substrate-binding domain-containing protein [Aureicoccus marinus]PQJ15366.1 hypothetical protein BST99_06080 [Aureicoccus marinus]
MTLQQLKYILALDKHRHFVKAAESCHVAQPTLTLQVKKLEEEVGMVLFDRSTQPLKPTPFGESFIQKASRVLGEMEELKTLVKQDRNQMVGEFRVGVIPTLAPSLLPLFISDFMESHPTTRLIIEELQSHRIMEQLENKQLDMGLMATPLHESNLREIPLFYEPFLIFTDQKNPLLKEYTVNSSQLKPEGLWILKQGHCFRNQTLNICEFDVSEQHRNLVMEGGTIETLKEMVRKVSGYTLIPELSYNSKNDQHNVRYFDEPQPVREVSIVVHKHFTKEKLITEMRKSILANTPEHFKKNTRFQKVEWR